MTPLKNFIYGLRDKNNGILFVSVGFFALISNSDRKFFDDWSLFFGCLFLAIAIGLMAYFKFYDQKKWALTSFNEVFRRLISAEKGAVYDVMGVLAILFLTSWAADACFNRQYLDALTNSVNIYNFLAIFVRYHPGREELSPPQLQKSTNLFIALSPLRNGKNKTREETLREIRAAVHGKQIENIKDFIETNWELPLRSICFHGEKLENLFLVLSKEAIDDFYPNFKDILADYKRTYRVDFEVHEIPGVDVNDWDSITTKVADSFSKVLLKGKPAVTFNISGGTSAVSGAFMLLAVKGEWQVEYFTQVPPEEKSELKPLSTHHKVFLGPTLSKKRMPE